MASNVAIVTTQKVEEKLILLRGNYVLLDRDVAELYGVETKRINEAYRNNLEKFPEGYVLALQHTETQYVVENFDRFKSLKYSAVDPRAFTERGLVSIR